MENYFNYFTEIEECYQRARGTRTLLSPLDWALIESWKEAGVPLEAVLLGIERAFEKFRKRPARIQKVNSLAYCSQLVLAAAQELGKSGTAGEGGTSAKRTQEIAPPFGAGEIIDYLRRNAAALEQAASEARHRQQSVLDEDLTGAAVALREAATQVAELATPDLEELERRMTALEEKLGAALTRASELELLTALRREVEKGLVPYRRSMMPPQVESLERQFLKKRLFDHYHIPRLSLFFL